MLTWCNSQRKAGDKQDPEQSHSDTEYKKRTCLLYWCLCKRLRCPEEPWTKLCLYFYIISSPCGHFSLEMKSLVFFPLPYSSVWTPVSGSEVTELEEWLRRWTVIKGEGEAVSSNRSFQVCYAVLMLCYRCTCTKQGPYPSISSGRLAIQLSHSCPVSPRRWFPLSKELDEVGKSKEIPFKNISRKTASAKMIWLQWTRKSGNLIGIGSSSGNKRRVCFFLWNIKKSKKKKCRVEIMVI